MLILTVNGKYEGMTGQSRMRDGGNFFYNAMKSEPKDLDIDVKGDEVICEVTGKYLESSTIQDFQSLCDDFRCFFLGS